MLKRVENLRKTFESLGIDGLFVSSPYNVRYLTGKNGSDCFLWIGKEEAVIITDFRYRELAQSMEGFSFFETNATTKDIDFLKALKEKRIGIEKEDLSLDKYLDMKLSLKDKEIIPVSEVIKNLRMVKDEDELLCLKEAEELGCRAFSHILPMIKPGLTELDIAAELEYYLRKNGSEGLSFSTIAISGAKTSRPHGIPGDKKLQNGEFLTLDFGCIYKGYCSDMTRTVALGNPTEEMKKVYNIVLKAQMNACEKIHANLTGKECDSLARDVIEQEGFGKEFGHSLGHGVGLVVHERPNFHKTYLKAIPENSVVSIEPGIYLEGKFGVRIEDLAIIKKDGIINLTNAPKELIIL